VLLNNKLNLVEIFVNWNWTWSKVFAVQNWNYKYK